jgi:hypothetical protein
VKISIRQTVELNDAEVEEVFHHHLNKLSDDRWINEDGKMMTEAYTSHRFDMEVGDENHPDFPLVKAIQELRAILKARKKSK